jgi:hypothetical protein
MTINPHVRQWLETPYEPEMGQGIDPMERIAKAMEYSAHHLSQINEKLDKLIEETAGIAPMIMMYGGKEDQ